MKLKLEDIKIVVIKDFYQQINNDKVKKYFLKLIESKKMGYSSNHLKTYLPLSQDDYYASHILMVNKKKQNQIICQAKIIPLSKSLYYNLDFPLFDICCDHLAQIEYKKLIDDILSFYQNYGEVSYSGGWTMDPLIKDKETRILLRELYTGIHYNFHCENNIKLIYGLGCPKFKTDEYFNQAWGFKYFNNFNASFKAKKLHDTEVKILFCKTNEVSSYKKTCGSNFKNLWENRMEFEIPRKQLKLIA